MSTEQLVLELSLLQAARLLLDDESHWCKRASARSCEGEAIHPTDFASVSWCAAGAIRAYVTHWDEVAAHTLDRLDVVCRRPLGTRAFNDNRSTTHSQILSVFDQAIVTACLELDGADNV